MNIIILNENKIKKVSYNEKLENRSFWYEEDKIITVSYGFNSFKLATTMDHVKRENSYSENGKFYFNPHVNFYFDDGSVETKYFPDTVESKSFLSELEKSLKFNIIKYQN